jgi:ribulose-phosphate 3-epimerase
MKISTSLICCDLSDIKSQIDVIIDHENFNWLHADFMDQKFVPRLGISPELIQSLRKRYGSRIFIDSHLMVKDPYSVADVIAPYSDWYIFHYEATTDPMRTLQMLRKNYKHLKIGLAFNILTPLYVIESVITAACKLGYIDGVMFMGISPGVLGTDSFIPEVKDRIKLTKSEFPDIKIFIDGSVKFESVGDYASLGADVCVSGSSMIFNSNSITSGMNMSDLINTNILRIKDAING